MGIDFLMRNQVFGEDAIDIFSIINKSSIISDFAILSGGFADTEKKLQNNKYNGIYWLNDIGKGNNACCVDQSGNLIFRHTYNRYIGGRPVLEYDKMLSLISKHHKLKNGLLKVNYGYFPQNVANKNISNQLEELYKCNELKKTNEAYTYDSVGYWKTGKGFNPESLKVYKLDKNKYVRVKANMCIPKIVLSNNIEYKNNCISWVEINPITWIVDEKNNLAVSEKILFSGIQFDKEKFYKHNFSLSDIKNYCDIFFINEINQKYLNSAKLEKLNYYKKLLLLKRNLIKEANQIDIELKDYEDLENELINIKNKYII